MGQFWARPIKITYPTQIHFIENAKNDIFDYMKVENNRKCPALRLCYVTILGGQEPRCKTILGTKNAHTARELVWLCLCVCTVQCTVVHPHIHFASEKSSRMVVNLPIITFIHNYPVFSQITWIKLYLDKKLEKNLIIYGKECSLKSFITDLKLDRNLKLIRIQQISLLSFKFQLQNNIYTHWKSPTLDLIYFFT